MIGDADGYWAPGEHRLPVRVQLEDIGGGDHVYNGQFLRFVERARTDMFRMAHAMIGGADPETQRYLVRRVELDLLRPAALHDILVVATRLARIGRSSLTLEHVLTRDDETIATAAVMLVFAIGGRSVQQPAAWIDAFRRATGQTELRALGRDT